MVDLAQYILIIFGFPQLSPKHVSLTIKLNLHDWSRRQRSWNRRMHKGEMFIDFAQTNYQLLPEASSFQLFYLSMRRLSIGWHGNFESNQKNGCHITLHAFSSHYDDFQEKNCHLAENKRERERERAIVLLNNRKFSQTTLIVVLKNWVSLLKIEFKHNSIKVGEI